MTPRRNEVLEASIKILSSATRQMFSSRLDSKKILLTPDGIQRDWRGLATQAHLNVGTISNGRISYFEHCWQLWAKNPGTVGQLFLYLEAMDRYDVIDDTLEMIYQDYDRVQSEVKGISTIPPERDLCYSYDQHVLTIDDVNNLENGGDLQHYDALVLYADEDIDFVHEMLEKLETEYGLKLCTKDRDLIAGLQFETEIITRLIMERCSRVILVLSPEFLASSINQYFTAFAHAISVDKRRRIVIPCQLRYCERPPIISFCHSLDYNRARGYWNFWEKLRDSVKLYSRAINSPPSIEPDQRIQEITSSTTVSAISENEASQSPSTPRSLFSKLALRKGDSSWKLKGSSSSLDSSVHLKSKPTPKDDNVSPEYDHTNGHALSSAIPIDKAGFAEQRYSTLSASVESADYMNTIGNLPDVPDTPPVSPMSTTSSGALLIGETTPSPKSSSSKFFDKLFKGRQKRKDYG